MKSLNMLKNDTQKIELQSVITGCAVAPALC